MPSAESVRAGAAPPALLTNTSRRGVFLLDLLRESSNGCLRRHVRDQQINLRRSGFPPISSSAAFPLSTFRQIMTTRAPIWARPSAVSFPIPLFAPVTIHIFPLILAGGITYDERIG